MKWLALSPLFVLECSSHAQVDPRGTPVTFRVVDFACELKILGQPVGLLELNKPKVVPLATGREHLVECTSRVSPPVKLYARYHLFVTSGRMNEVELNPVSVLPNAVKAVAAGGIVATTVRDAVPQQCQRSPQAASAPFWNRERGELAAASGQPVIPKGTKVTLSGTRPDFCFDTNLVEVVSPSGSVWYRSKDFEFSVEGKIIRLYPPSQDSACCWIN